MKYSGVRFTLSFYTTAPLSHIAMVGAKFWGALYGYVPVKRIIEYEMGSVALGDPFT